MRAMCGNAPQVRTDLAPVNSLVGELPKIGQQKKTSVYLASEAEKTQVFTESCVVA